MRRYVGLIDGEAGAYGIVFPDLPGCNAMGATIEETIANGASVMRSWFEAMEDKRDGINHPTSLEALRRLHPEVDEALKEGATAVLVPLVRITGRSVKANLSIDEGILAVIDSEAARRKLTHSGYIETLVRELMPSGIE